MKKTSQKQIRPLKLRVESLKLLSNDDLAQVVGGSVILDTRPPPSFSCVRAG